MAVDILVECGEEEHRVRLLPDDVAWPDGAHDADLEEGLIELGAPRPQCLVLRRAWLGQRKNWEFPGHQPFPFVSPIAPLQEVLDMGDANRYDRSEAVILLLADFLQHVLDSAGLAEEYLKAPYAVVKGCRNRILMPHTTTTSALRAATAMSRRQAEAYSNYDDAAHIVIGSLHRAANQLGLSTIDAVTDVGHHRPETGWISGATVRRTLSNIMNSQWAQGRSRQDMISETVWQRHRALEAYEAMIEGKPWPSM